MACRHCGTDYRHTQSTGCCSACGNVFTSQSAFDAHRYSDADGRRCCRSPFTAVRKGRPMFMESARSKPGAKPLWSLWSSESERDERFGRFKEEDK